MVLATDGLVVMDWLHFLCSPGKMDPDSSHENAVESNGEHAQDGSNIAEREENAPIPPENTQRTAIGAESSKDNEETAAKPGKADAGKERREKKKPEDIKIVDQAESSDIQSPLSALSQRSYGGMQPTELLLAYPSEESPGPSSSCPQKQRNGAFESDEDEKEKPLPDQVANGDVPEKNLNAEEKQASDLVQPVETEVLTCAIPVEQEPSPSEEDKPPDYPFADKQSHETAMVEESDLVQEFAIEMDTDGADSTVEECKPQLTQRQEVSRENIKSNIYAEIEKVDEAGEEGNVDNTCCGMWIDVCCQSCTCTLSNPLAKNNRNKKAQPAKKLLELSPRLRKGRSDGVKDFLAAIFPLIPDVLRVVWVVIELALVIVGLVLSIVSLSLDENEVFNIVHFVLIIVSTVLACFDGFFTIRSSDTCKKLFSRCKCKSKAENVTMDKEDAQNGCRKCCSHCTNLFDLLRLLISEAIFYPLLICDIFELIVGRGFEGKSSGDRLGFALFIISLLGMVLTVYVARIIVLAGMVKNATAIRTPDPKQIGEEQDDYDPNIKRSAVCYQASFCAHVVLQMFAQVLMYIAIAAKIRYDNRHFYQFGNTDESIHVTAFLWYMIVAAYIVPFVGLLTFFIVTYYWSQQYPIGFHLDMISIFKMTEYGMFDVLRIKDTVKEKVDTLKEKMMEEDEGTKMDRFFSAVVKPLKKDFEELFHKPWCDKFTYPFKTPLLVIICLGYAVLQLVFVICASQAVNEMGEVMTHVLNGGGWVYYYLFAIITGIVANLYVFIVAGIWIAIITGIIIAIAAIIACIALVCVLGCALAMCNNDSKQRNY
jgi:hypothetical protein